MNIKQRRLPSAYQEVEWIGTTAEGGQYFQSNIVPTENMGFKMKYYQESSQGFNAIICSYNPEGSGQWGLRQRNSDWQCIRASNFAFITVRYFATLTNIEFNINNDGKIRITQNGIIDETTLPTYSTNNVPLAIFAQTNGSAVGWHCIGGRIYSLEFIDYTSGSSIVANLIPCYRISDSEIGMYDTVNGTFYTNQGTGSFTKGADVVTVDSITIPQGDVAVIRQGNQKIWQRLPWEYQEVEWIENTSASYINTGYAMSSNNEKIEIGYLRTVNSGSIFGSYNSSNALFSLLSYSYSTYQQHWVGSNGQRAKTNIPVDTYVDSVFVANNGNLSVSYNGQTVTDTYTSSVANGMNIYIFGRNINNSISESAKARICYFRLYDNNVKVIDYVPCYRISDNVIGMFDLVSGTFFMNQGTGTFTKGNDK